MNPATNTTKPATHAILPTGGGLEFDSDAEFFHTYDEAMEEALDWSVEVSRAVRVYAKKGEQWIPLREVEA
jgi:hypothetical protein